MRRWVLAIVGLVAGFSCALAARPAVACGPGVHIREAERLLDRLAAVDPEWATIDEETPLARSWLRLGSVAPDFGFAVPGLTFSGHDLRLSYHLFDSADLPERRLFALGHLAHQNSDPACETFITATMLASAPLGLFDLLEGYDDNQGESEGLIELFGDLVLGDWDAVVDMLFDFWADGDEAKARTREIIGWYCESGAAYSGRTIDCPAVIADLEGMVARVDTLIAGLDRAGAHALLDSIIDKPLPQLADFFASGALTPLLGDQIGGPSSVVDQELARFKASALVDPAFWARYDESFRDLGPSFALDRIELRTTGFPAWDAPSMVCGNVQSVMAFLPEHYDVQPGFVVDRVEWQDGAGAPLSSVDADHEGADLQVHVRFFAALPLDGTVRAVVRRDRPGLATDDDDVVGSVDVPFTADPAAYVTTPRAELTVPFAADVDGALGFYLELSYAPTGTAIDDVLPTFTTSWDRLWTVSDLPFDRPVYQDNFDTYGHWPPSLRVASTPVEEGTLFAKGYVPPAGGGVDGAVFTLRATAAQRTAGTSGIVVFDPLAPGDWQVSATAPGHAPSASVTATVAAGQRVWASVPLHPVPAVVLAGEWLAPDDDGCVPFSWDRAPFQGQARSWLATLVDDQGATLVAETDVGAAGHGALCPAPEDGTTVAVRLRARYSDDTPGVEGTSAPATIDGSPPVIEEVFAEVDTDRECLPAGEPVPWLPPVRVGVRYDEPHALIMNVAWRILPDETWHDVGWFEDEPGELWFPLGEADRAGGSRLRVRLTNAVGGEASSATTILPTWTESNRCPEPPPDVVEPPDAGPDTAPDSAGGADTSADTSTGTDTAADEDTIADTAPDTTIDTAADTSTGADAGTGAGSGSSGGCSATGRAPSGGALIVLLLLAGALILRRPRRRAAAAP